jgi:hypothetical protein
MTKASCSRISLRKELASRRISTAAILVVAVCAGACSPSSSTNGTCHAPLATWARPQEGIPHLAVVNRITLSARNELHWNGVAITETQLQSYLREIRGAVTHPFTIFDPDPASDCAMVRRIRELIDTSLSCNRGRCGEGRGWAPASGVIIVQ